jgi:hypothetical protein
MVEPSKDSAYAEIIARLRALQESKPPDIPLIDPTANVLSLVAAAIARQDDLRTAEFQRQDDLRKQAEYFNKQLVQERQRAEADAKRAEAGRIDALLVANTNNVALALEKQGAQAQAQDKRIAALEQNQYQGVGGKLQQTEGRQVNQWTMTTVLFGIIGLVGMVATIITVVIRLK